MRAERFDHVLTLEPLAYGGCSHLLGQYPDWSHRMLRVITENDGVHANIACSSPCQCRTWEHATVAARLGDAAHLMPSLGVGINLFVLDASKLSVRLEKAH
ncbi:hypothetical protein [Streptomyces sp. NBC_01257]|uniref:hypothetical protein n=1 Tax=Streptomyces sp. NBC_01257 TaxID=2903799 RepID=UPI002DDAA177|nr:hypothetical protein [Streptomyces sp. NBC_01257]WRZ69261.1 hypothetical protein OG408_37565 [Streptomyces sp. NBC_01257]